MRSFFRFIVPFTIIYLLTIAVLSHVASANSQSFVPCAKDDVACQSNVLLSNGAVDYSFIKNKLYNSVVKIYIQRSNGGAQCSGNLLTDGVTIITAKHCIDGMKLTRGKYFHRTNDIIVHQESSIKVLGVFIPAPRPSAYDVKLSYGFKVGGDDFVFLLTSGFNKDRGLKINTHHPQIGEKMFNGNHGGGSHHMQFYTGVVESIDSCWIRMKMYGQGGASGSAIINANAEIMGVMSHGTSDKVNPDLAYTRPILTYWEQQEYNRLVTMFQSSNVKGAKHVQAQ